VSKYTHRQRISTLPPSNARSASLPTITDAKIGLFSNEFSAPPMSTSRITNKKGPRPTMTVN
jgi:hypothetical protein